MANPNTQSKIENPKSKIQKEAVVIIPSRYGSTRFAGKPLVLISGVSMIQRVYERASRSSCVRDVIVATDDRRIFDSVLNFGGKAVMTSPGNRSGTDRVAEAAEITGLSMEDIVINVQGDQPLLEPGCLDEIIAPFLEDPAVEMSTLAFRIVDRSEITNPKDVKVALDRNGYALYFSRSPIPYGRDTSHSFDTYKHLGIYAYTRGFLEKYRGLPEGELERIEKLEQLRALEYGYRIKVVVTRHDSPEVDLPEDIPRIERILQITA